MNHLGMHYYYKHKKDKHRFWMKFVDKGVYVVSIISQIMTLPQLYNIWILKNASGVSAISWAFYTFGTTFWLIYGMLHKEKPLVFSYSIWIVLNLAVTIGVLLYG